MAASIDAFHDDAPARPAVTLALTESIGPLHAADRLAHLLGMHTRKELDDSALATAAISLYLHEHAPLINGWGEERIAGFLHTCMRHLTPEDSWSSGVMAYPFHAPLHKLITVYRGIDVPGSMAGRLNGLSWTLDEATAHWFAGRTGRPPVVISRRVRASSIIAVIEGRGESEVLIAQRLRRFETITFDPSKAAQPIAAVARARANEAIRAWAASTLENFEGRSRDVTRM